MKKIFILIAILWPLLGHAQLAGNSMQLKADGNFITVPDASSATLNSTMTWEFWIYYRCVNGVAGTTPITKGWCNTNWSYLVQLINGKLAFEKYNPAGTGACPNGAKVRYESPANSVPFNTWTHCAVVMSGTTIQLYINGQAVTTTLISGTPCIGIKNSARPVLIGAYQNLAGSYISAPKSNIDEVRIWHTARTQAEIQATMNTELVGNET